MASHAFAAGEDSQLWTSIYTTVGINRHFDVVMNGQLRTGDDFSDLVRESMQVGFKWKALPHLVFSPSYTFIDNQPVEGSASTENRASFLTSIDFPICAFRVVVGNEFELRFRPGDSDSWRSRPRLTIEHPMGPASWGLSGYLSDEGFYDSHYGGWVRNRFYAGLKKKLTRVATLDLYYLRQDDDETTPGDLNVMGITLRFYFDMMGAEDRQAHVSDGKGKGGAAGSNQQQKS